MKLMNMIAAAVRGLNNLAGLLPVLQNLGRRHAGYGVKEKDYATVGQALIWTLEKGFGSAFTRMAGMGCCLHGDCRYDEKCRNRKWHNGFDNLSKRFKHVLNVHSLVQQAVQREARQVSSRPTANPALAR